MRRLLWFTVGFGAGCGICVGVLWQSSLVPMLVYALLSGITCLALSGRNDLFRVPAVIFLGASLSFGWFTMFRGLYLQPTQELDGQTASLRVVATDYSEKSDYGFWVEAVTELDGKYYRLRAFQKDRTQLAPGDAMESEFRLRLTTPGGKKDSAYYQGGGVFLVANQRGETVHIRAETDALWALPARIRAAGTARLTRFFPEDTAPFARALLLGDTSVLSYSQDTALKISGIRHVAAVSGLHISILFSLVFLFTKFNRWAVFLVSTPVLLFFAAITGFSPSVTRACLMCGLISFGAAANREYDPLTSLSFACLVMLLMNPFVLLSVSFQLSVSSVAGILLFASPVAQWLLNRIPSGKKKGVKGNLGRWFAGSIAVTVSAQMLSAPLSAYYFGAVSLIGVLTNLLTIWVMGLLFWGIGAVACLGGLLPGLCQWLGWLLSWPIRFVLFTAQTLSRVPFAAVYTQSQFIVVWLVVCYVLLALFLVFRRRRRLLFAVGLIGLGAAIGASVIQPRLDNLRLNVLDVGEGQSILLQAGGRNYLIDCGGDSPAQTADMAAQTLLSQGVFRLDGVILTHYDRDHVNALENLLTRIPVEHFFLPAQEGIQLPETESCSLVSQDTEIPLGSGKLVLLDPGSDKSDNESCMCVLFESEECVILITGDRGRTGERRLMGKYQLPDVDVLIAGHHGSKYSTCEELLQAVRPETVIISVGKNNSYGHPAQELLDRLMEYDCTVYRTDMQGSILVRR